MVFRKVNIAYCFCVVLMKPNCTAGKLNKISLNERNGDGETEI